MPNNSENLTQPMPPQLEVAAIYQMLRDIRQEDEDGRKKVLAAFLDLSARVAIAQSQVITMTEAMKVIAQDAADSRALRLQTEVAKDEREKRILEERIRIVDEQLVEKKTMTVSALDTTNRMKLAANLTYEEREKLEEDAQKAVWKERHFISPLFYGSHSISKAKKPIPALAAVALFCNLNPTKSPAATVNELVMF